MQGGGDGESNSCRGHAESTDIYSIPVLHCTVYEYVGMIRLVSC